MIVLKKKNTRTQKTNLFNYYSTSVVAKARSHLSFFFFFLSSFYESNLLNIDLELYADLLHGLNFLPGTAVSVCVSNTLLTESYDLVLPRTLCQNSTINTVRVNRVNGKTVMLTGPGESSD